MGRLALTEVKETSSANRAIVFAIDADIHSREKTQPPLLLNAVVRPCFHVLIPFFPTLFFRIRFILCTISFNRLQLLVRLFFHVSKCSTTFTAER